MTSNTFCGKGWVTEYWLVYIYSGMHRFLLSRVHTGLTRWYQPMLERKLMLYIINNSNALLTSVIHCDYMQCGNVSSLGPGTIWFLFLSPFFFLFLTSIVFLCILLFFPLYFYPFSVSRKWNWTFKKIIIQLHNWYSKEVWYSSHVCELICLQISAWVYIQFTFISFYNI